MSRSRPLLISFLLVLVPLAAVTAAPPERPSSPHAPRPALPQEKDGGTAVAVESPAIAHAGGGAPTAGAEPAVVHFMKVAKTDPAALGAEGLRSHVQGELIQHEKPGRDLVRDFVPGRERQLPASETPDTGAGLTKAVGDVVTSSMRCSPSPRSRVESTCSGSATGDPPAAASTSSAPRLADPPRHSVRTSPPRGKESSPPSTMASPSSNTPPPQAAAAAGPSPWSIPSPSPCVLPSRPAPERAWKDRYVWS